MIDSAYTDLAQFASQLEYADDGLIAWMEENFEGDQSPEYYRGLLAGFANSKSLTQSMSQKGADAMIGSIVAFVASKIRKQEHALSP